MPLHGFGQGGFGHTQFGNINWCKVVLWDELDDKLRADDLASGGAYLKFVESMAPSFNYLRAHISRFRQLMDPATIRHDLLLYFASNFGITIDLAEPEAYQRMRADLAMRWNLIKGEEEAYVVLCRVHGFEVTVVPLWWNGDSYVEGAPEIVRESSASSVVVDGGSQVFTIRPTCYPIEPGTITLRFDNVGTPYSVTDYVDPVDGLGKWTGYSGSIDYGWGYLEITIPNLTDTFLDASYTSVAGGCVDSCIRCKTHRIRLDIVPGDIAGQDQLTITDAFQRLYKKLGVYDGNGVIPVHVELAYDILSGTAVLSLNNHFDVIDGDVIPLDGGLGWSLP